MQNILFTNGKIQIKQMNVPFNTTKKPIRAISGPSIHPATNIKYLHCGSLYIEEGHLAQMQTSTWPETEKIVILKYLIEVNGVKHVCTMQAKHNIC